MSLWERTEGGGVRFFTRGRRMLERRRAEWDAIARDTSQGQFR